VAGRRRPRAAPPPRSGALAGRLRRRHARLAAPRAAHPRPCARDPGRARARAPRVPARLPPHLDARVRRLRRRAALPRVRHRPRVLAGRQGPVLPAVRTLPSGPRHLLRLRRAPPLALRLGRRSRRARPPPAVPARPDRALRPGRDARRAARDPAAAGRGRRHRRRHAWRASALPARLARPRGVRHPGPALPRRRLPRQRTRLRAHVGGGGAGAPGRPGGDPVAAPRALRDPGGAEPGSRRVLQAGAALPGRARLPPLSAPVPRQRARPPGALGARAGRRVRPAATGGRAHRLPGDARPARPRVAARGQGAGRSPGARRAGGRATADAAAGPRYHRGGNGPGGLMAILGVRKYGDPVLRRRAERVREVTPEIQATVRDMIDTMYHEVGIGLAAPQVGVTLRLMVVDEEKGRGALALINPEIVDEGGRVVAEEGCLSIPGIFATVARAER